MNFFALILAQAEDEGAGFDNELRNRVITFGAYAFVILAVFIWAVFIRKQKRKRHRSHKHKPHTWEVSEEVKAQRRHHRRARKTPEFPANPTRAEAGGLPPRREEKLDS